MLTGRLAAVRRLNPKLPLSAVEEVVHFVTAPTETSLARKNRAFLFVNGLPLGIVELKNPADANAGA